MVKAVLTDIEGTTSSLAFVKDTLFPYARERMAAFVAQHGREPAVAKLLDDVRREAAAELSDAQAVEQLVRWIDQDRKVTPLKALQGMIWETGYRNGDYTGHVYADAVEALRRWQAQGLGLYVYSSGSVQAQKLLFGYSDAGNLTPLFSGYFDTTVGNKRDAAAYRRIAAAIGVAPHDILFLSDIDEELDAARAAGLQTVWLVRHGQPDPAAAHRQVSDFRSIDPA